jgi:hypothetical protein
MMLNLIEALPSNSATDVASILDNPEGPLLDRVLRLIR